MESFEVETAGVTDLPGVITLLDRMFVAPRHRTPSLAARYPSVMALGDRNRVWIIKHRGTVASCVLVKRRTWLCKGGSFELAMIGGVCTDPNAAARGMASQLVKHAEQEERARGVATMVLWTTIAPFYERLGWQAEDPGVLGTLRRYERPCKKDGSELWVGSPSSSVDRLERIRREWVAEGLARSAADYASIPFPAQAVNCHFAVHDGLEAYALVGYRGETGYVYEAVGHPRALEPLWASVQEHYERVCINDSLGTQSMRWLEANARVEWQPKPLAMWRGEWRGYVPYFDRI